MAVVDVRIAMVGGTFVPSQESVKLSKSKGDTIRWYNDTAEQIRLSFTGGVPFAADHHPYEIGAGKQVNSGHIQAAEETTWFYTITAASGAMADPQVIIER
jgi:hypothetical protein